MAGALTNVELDGFPRRQKAVDIGHEVFEGGVLLQLLAKVLLPAVRKGIRRRGYTKTKAKGRKDHG